MSSSQGAPVGNNGGQISAGYSFDRDSIRDSSDWTTFIKQKTVYNSPKPLQTTDPWIPYSPSYRLTFLSGKFKCTSCTGNAYGSGTILQ
jgi:hypothetical protein